MSKRIKDEEYVSLLEQAVSSGTVHIDTGPMNAGKGKGDISKTGPEAGMKYRGVTVDGDKILNWEGDGDQYQAKKLDDVDDLVETLTGEVQDEHDWDSPMSMLESDDGDKDDDDDDKEEEGEEKKEDEDEEKEEEEEELDVDEELEESFNNVSFTSTETEVLSKLIQEMNMLEEDADVLAEDADESGETTEEEIDLDI